MAFSPTPDIQNEKMDAQYHQAVMESSSDTQARYAVDSLAMFVNLNSDNRTEREVNKAVSTLLRNGSYENNQERTSTMKNWTKKTANQSAKTESINIIDSNISITKLSINTKLKLNTQSNILTTNHTKENSKRIRNVVDPLLESTSYNRKINYCGFKSPAKKIFNQSQVSQTSGTTRGKAIVEPSTLPANNREDKMIITLDITNYSQSETKDFAGYFSKKQPSTPSNYNNNYTVGTSSNPDIQEGQRTIIHDGLWKSHFYQAIPKDCYMPTSNQITPNIYERINESTRGIRSEGIYTIVNPEINESDVGYERLNNQSLDIIEIETISEKKSWPKFNMSRSLAQAEGLDKLIK